MQILVYSYYIFANEVFPYFSEVVELAIFFYQYGVDPEVTMMMF